MSAALTDKERQILATAWECFDVQPKVNYPLLAEKLGYKTPASANTAFLAAKKKLLSGSGGSPVKASPAGKGKRNTTPAKPKKKGGKRVKSEVESDDEEDDVPAKKLKQDDEEGGDEDGVKVKNEGDGVDGEAADASE